MLAGVGGVDCALFVVDASEGWRPQSAEHLAILDLLGIPAGVVALTKVDLTGDEATGATIVRRALEEPLKQIAFNAGLEGGVVIEKVRSLDPGQGLNAATGEYTDMFKAGIVDPAKVVRSALQNAASIAALFLTTEAVVADKPEKEKAPAMPGGGDPDNRRDFPGGFAGDARNAFTNEGRTVVQNDVFNHVRRLARDFHRHRLLAGVGRSAPR